MFARSVRLSTMRTTATIGLAHFTLSKTFDPCGAKEGYLWAPLMLSSFRGTVLRLGRICAVVRHKFARAKGHWPESGMHARTLTMMTMMMMTMELLVS